MDLQGAIQEAGRCLLCYDAPCNSGCAADNEPATFIRQLRLGNLKGAVRAMRRNNILAATCAPVCPGWDCVGTAEVAAAVISGSHRAAMELVPRG